MVVGHEVYRLEQDDSVLYSSSLLVVRCSSLVFPLRSDFMKGYYIEITKEKDANMLILFI